MTDVCSLAWSSVKPYRGRESHVTAGPGDVVHAAARLTTMIPGSFKRVAQSAKSSSTLDAVRMRSA